MLKRKQQQTTLYKVTYKFYEEEQIYEGTFTSASLASLDADYCVEILTVEKL
jgi:hypothetical protein